MLLGLTFEVDFDILLLGLTSKLIVALETIQKVLSAGRMRHMFNAKIDLLGDDASTNALVYNNTDSMFGHIEHTTSLAVIELVRHTFMKGTIAFDVHNIAAFVDFEKSRQLFGAMVLEAFREEITRAASNTFRVCHCGDSKAIRMLVCAI